jgi:hypothetical protein
MEASVVDMVESILQSAKKLNSIDRISIANALLKDIPEQLKKGLNLPLLSGLNEQELRVLAITSLSPSRNKRLKYLLNKNREGKISQQESAELDQILAESDQIALLKAKAQYTLKKIQSH